jgi:O-succinylbenzoic acid--CoA ligase
MFRLSLSKNNLQEILATAIQKCTRNDVGEWEQKVWLFLAQWLDESKTHISVTTSGSTGAPKSISHSKKAMRQSAINTIQALRLTKNDVALLCLPADKIGGMMMIVRAMVLELDLIYIKPSANPWVEIISHKDVSFLACTPMQLSASFNDETSFQSANHIRHILLGGGIITPTMSKYLSQMTNNVYHTFGMTETISHIALKKVSGEKPDTNFTTIGDTNVQEDERNCLIINATDLEIENMSTNDVVHVVSANSFEWLGRWDNVINTGGIKVYPETLEELLSQTLTFPFFIFGKANETTGERICLATEADSSISEIRKAVNNLPKNSQPKEVHFIEKMKYTTTGKIDRSNSLINTVSIVAL